MNEGVMPGLVPLTDAARKVVLACQAVGRPLVVGGSVRDALRTRMVPATPFNPKDIDLEVYGADAGDLLTVLQLVGRVDEVGVSFGVLKVHVDGEEFDVSLPRVDSKVGSGHRGFAVRVDHDLTVEQAFGRRDFTVNAMGWDPITEELVDPYGGLIDLIRGVLRHTTPAFAEDPLRVLRGVQFAGRFNMVLAPETVEMCRTLRACFYDLATERIWEEFKKIATKALHPSRSLEVLHQTGWEEFFPELLAVRDVPQDPDWHPEGPVHVHLGLAADAAAQAAHNEGWSEADRMVVVFGAMLHDLGKATHTDIPDVADGRITSHGHAEAGVEPARSFLTRIGAPGWLVDKVLPLVREHMAVASGKPTKAAVRRLLRRLDHDGRGPTIQQWAAVVAADHAGRGIASHQSPAGPWEVMAHLVGTPQGRPRKGILTGHHLIALGLKPGPAFKEILSAALETQDDGVFDDEEGALAWLAGFLGADWVSSMLSSS
jgi:tRNA nucleotidyltransferase (CCA-adding enzyme)